MGCNELWVPLYLAKAYGMDLKQIALFAWLPFLCADLGSIASGYLTKLYTRLFGLSRVNSVIASSVSGAFLMVSLAVIAFIDNPYIAIVLISIGGFGHQIISCMLSAPVVESFDKGRWPLLMECVVQPHGLPAFVLTDYWRYC